MPSDDQEVAAGYLRGEAKALGVVDGWISRAAWPYQRRLANRWDDVLQEIRLEVMRLLGQAKFRGESSLRTYLWRVVSHTCLDQLRAQAKWQWADVDDLDDLAGREAASAQARPAAAGHEDRDLALRVLARATKECREMWRLILLGLSYREMSLRLGVAEGTLRVRVLRCRERAVAARRELLAQPPATGRNVTTGEGA
ncbi:MAG TPA: RNA polymerase sigma factor [Thermoanaerobaculia bacterium]|nr:RNA polymerase sigma factor [Thermoanaerobaculia bacterium]